MDMLRCMHWNILEGFRKPLDGRNPEDAEIELDDKRLALAQKVIKSINPDILVLNEALWCTEYNGQLIDYRKLLGFEFGFGHLYQKEWGNMILSHLEISCKQVFSIHNRSAVVVNLETPMGPLCVSTYHPHPSRRAHLKAEDLLSVVRVSQTNGALPTLICGDMNCVNPEDLPNQQRLLTGFANFSKNPEKDVMRFLEGGEAIFPSLADVGFQDAMPKSGRHYTIPTDLLNANKSTAMRLDHVFANSLVTVKSGTVVENPEVEWASDHRPLYLDISF